MGRETFVILMCLFSLVISVSYILVIELNINIMWVFIVLCIRKVHIYDANGPVCYKTQYTVQNYLNLSDFSVFYYELVPSILNF